MTNIEKVKRILDAGHWVKVVYKDGIIINITSYYWSIFTYINPRTETVSTTRYDFVDCTIEVIQRITTPYKQGEKVRVLSNPEPDNKYTQDMVWKVYDVESIDVWGIYILDIDSDSWYIPHSCIAPAFDDELTLSWKEVTVTIDGKEYTAVIK